jgi:hypothetical protein
MISSVVKRYKLKNDGHGTPCPYKKNDSGNQPRVQS